MNYQLKRGQALVIIGPQGCGKSTLARQIASTHGMYEDKNWIIPEIFLRKKQPPQTKKREMDQIVSWKDCGWQPQKQVENQHG